jgi:hypothetical protein
MICQSVARWKPPVSNSSMRMAVAPVCAYGNAKEKSPVQPVVGEKATAVISISLAVENVASC